MNFLIHTNLKISKFNKLFEKNIKIPHELRTEDNLKNYLYVISDKKKFISC